MTIVRDRRALIILAVGLATAPRVNAQACSGSWSPLGSGTNDTVAGLTTMPDGSVIAGGFFTSAGGGSAKSVAQWTPGAGGTGAWSALGAGVGNFGEYVNVVAALANGDVIAGGSFSAAGGNPASDIARWNGTNWSAVSTGLDSYVRAVLPRSGGDFIAGGAFTRTGPPGGSGGTTVNCVALWNSSLGAWQPLGLGTDSVVTGLGSIPGGDVIAGGAFFNAGTVPARSVARWGGGGWSEMPPGMFNQFVWAVEALPNGDVIAGGEFISIGAASIFRIARWDGTNWNAMGSGMNLTVYALAVLPNGDLLAGGDFTLAGGVTAPRVARWDGSVWSPLGTGTNGTVNALTVLPGGDVVAGGLFSVAGGQQCSCIARWSPPGGYANCDGSTTAPVLNVLDFSCFLNRFAAGDTYANCDHSTTPPVLNVLDFSCFLNSIAAGCS